MGLSDPDRIFAGEFYRVRRRVEEANLLILSDLYLALESDRYGGAAPGIPRGFAPISDCWPKR